MPELVVHIDTARRYQRIENFGASGAWSLDPIGKEWTEANKNILADLLFSREKGIGLSLWRFNIGAGGALTDQLWDPWRGAEVFKASEDAEYDWSKHAGQQWFLRAAKKRGVERFLACVYSPPVWMTKNGHAHCDKQSGSTNLKPGYEPHFARFLADVLEHFAKEGLPFHYISPVNEPNWDWEGGQEGCRYNNEDLKRVIHALYDEVRSRRLATEIVVPEAGELVSLLDDQFYRRWARIEDARAAHTHGNRSKGWGMYGQYIRELLGDAEMRRKVGNRLCAHSYWTDSSLHLLRDLRRTVRENMDSYAPGAQYWQTEYCVMEHRRDLGMDTALRVARVIHYDLTAANASAWHWWLAVSPYDYKDGLIYTDYRQTGQQNILPSKTLWVLGNFSRFIRPGAVRVHAEPSEVEEHLLISAYTQNRSPRLVCVVVHRGEKEVTLRLDAGQRVEEWSLFITSTEHDLARQPAVKANREVVIPPRSVVTLTSS
jgi:O-glycosyl hydrolase